MSKFCKIISNGGKNAGRPSSVPLTFQQLENFIDWVGSEFLEAEADFVRKAASLVERDVVTAGNGDLLRRINDGVQNCARKLTMLDQEIKQEEKILKRLNKVVGKMEKRSEGNPRYHNHSRSDVAAIVKLMESLDSQLKIASADVESVNQILSTKKRQRQSLPRVKETEKVITSIINLQLDLLLHVERSLKSLDENCESVDCQLRFLLEKHMKSLPNMSK